MDYKEKVIALLNSQELSKEQKEKLEELFPQLKDSEDEKIKEELMQYLWDLYHQAFAPPTPSFDTCNKWLGWIEKQGEQKSTDKVEPKFKVGDWITDGKALLHVTKFEVVHGYELKAIDGKVFYFVSPDLVDEYYYLWTIQDAKDGDVLVDEYNNIGIYQRKVDNVDWHSYIYLGYDNHLHDFNIGGYHNINNTKPATKEQRKQLEKAMADAGYTFDFDKKELKKIEQKSAWSE